MAIAYVEAHLPGWLAARRYGAPAEMIATATRRREAGDWRGACAAARFDIRFDLRQIRAAHGTQTAARLENDLLHFAPDLARWHAPRGRGPLGPLAAGWAVTLAEYDGVRLTMRMPAHVERPQRIALHCGPGLDGTVRGVEDWAELRYLWDARVAPQLLHRLGGGDRTPFFRRNGTPLSLAEIESQDGGDPVTLVERVMLMQDVGEIEAAWQAAGFQADLADATSTRRRTTSSH